MSKKDNDIIVWRAISAFIVLFVLVKIAVNQGILK